MPQVTLTISFTPPARSFSFEKYAYILKQLYGAKRHKIILHQAVAGCRP